LSISSQSEDWPGYRAEKGNLYLTDESRPNTRYMGLEEYQGRPISPDPTKFDEQYFKNKSRPQDSQGNVLQDSQPSQLPIQEQLPG
jgi:hypothetical protein